MSSIDQAVTSSQTLYKCLAAGRRGPYSGVVWEPEGVWMPAITGPLRLCERGYHLCRADQLTFWLSEEIYEAEAAGDRMEDAQKLVVSEAKLVRRLAWNQNQMVRFAADCAERVLPLSELAESVARAARTARAESAQAESARAAESAQAAARAAAWAAQAARAAAAWAAQAEAGADAERQWQTQRLLQYLYGELPA